MSGARPTEHERLASFKRRQACADTKLGEGIRELFLRFLQMHPPFVMNGNKCGIGKSIGCFQRVLAAHRHVKAPAWFGPRPYEASPLSGRSVARPRPFHDTRGTLTGTTVGQWLLAQRLAYAQRMLETTRQPVETVAQLAGFGSAVSLRQHFSRTYRTSPSAYRALFTQA